MSDTGSERPTPPSDLDDDLRDALEDLSDREPATIEAVASYVTELESWVESASTVESQSRSRESERGDENDDTVSPAFPEDVPERATVSMTEVAGTAYRYYQWRDGDEIRSKTVELE